MENQTAGHGFRVAALISPLSNQTPSSSPEDPSFARLPMRTMYSKALGVFFAICGIPPADAQDGLPLRQLAPNAATLPASLTGKERLGKKWMDEQRIDNCNVPADKRGTKPRPSACPVVPTG
jgi:hypothetical protein